MDVSTGLTLVQTVLQLFDSTIWTDIGSVLGVEAQLEGLKETMSTINDVLSDAEKQERLQQGRCSNTERGKLKKLKEALYRADDLFDEVITLAHRNELMTDNNLCNKVSLCFSTSNKFCSAFYWSREIKRIRNMLDYIVRDYQLTGLGHTVVSLEANRVRNNPRETYSLVHEGEDVIIGRDEDKRVVIDMLLDTTVETDVCVTSIVGIGGLGKTTLAQLVYNDEKIRSEFSLKMWVCVSEDFNVKELLVEILAAAKPATNQENKYGLSLDRLQKELLEALDGKKYLLVLDDVWNENSEEWRTLRTVLTQGGRGSRIVVTTRSQAVAYVVESQKVHELKGLSEVDSWNLFERMTLVPGEHQLEAPLVDIGKEIVRKCANVPLAIRVSGSLLRGHGEERWRYMKNTDFAKVKQDDRKGIISVLKISYYYFPSYMKSCFSYCAIFPKDYKIIKEDLICLWMAQGFVMPLDGKSFEAAGDEYFMELLQRCFFQDVERDDWGGVLSCKMHDLIHDVATEVAGNEIYNGSCFNEKTRHVFSQRPCLHLATKKENFRTLLLLHDNVRGVARGSVRSLRVLRWPRIYPIPSMIGELLHLRYLDLSHHGVSVLPESITKLYNLQTLKLFGCENLKELPRDLSKLVNLRHLDLDGCLSLTDMPKGIACLTNLQKLTRFVFGGTRNSSAGVSDLKHLTNLRGSLQIDVLNGFIYDEAEVREGKCLINKPHVLNINIRCSWNNSEAFSECLQPHSNLRMLELWRYYGVQFPSWGGPSMNLATCLPNLVQIVLNICTRLKHLPLMSQLRHLKFLKLLFLWEIVYVDTSNIRGVDVDERVFFPSLETLILNDLPKSKGWWKSSYSAVKSGNGDRIVNKYSISFPRLLHANIIRCPELITFPLCPRLERLLVSGSNELVLDNEAEEEEEEEEMTPSSRSTSGDSHCIQPHTSRRCIRFAPTLRSLEFRNLPKMVELPLGMRHLTALHSLQIIACHELKAIPQWISCLSSLQSLKIEGCRGLKSIPEEMRDLTSLQQLHLYYISEELYNRCLEPTGVDWPKIQRITNILMRE